MNEFEEFLDDIQYELMSAEELASRIDSYRSLCLGRKINTNNAFDINMIAYFHTWLEKKKSLNSSISSFQDLAGFLETSGTIYSYRVDNVGNTTNKLLDEIRTLQLKNDIYISNKENDRNASNHVNEIKSETEDEDSRYEDQDVRLQTIDVEENDYPNNQMLPTRLKLMLITEDKLKSTKLDTLGTKQKVFFGFPEYFKTSYPDKHLVSLFFDYSIKEEIIESKNEKNKHKKDHIYQLNDEIYNLIDNEIDETDLCSDLYGFVSERDSNDGTKNTFLQGIEHYFNPEDNKFLKCTTDSICNGVDMDCDEFDIQNSNFNVKDEPNIDLNDQPETKNLLKCIDDMNREYSFFNPQLLANWKGPKSWKDGAMVKALKSRKPSEQKQIIETLIAIDDDSNNKCKQPKTKNCKKLTKPRKKSMGKKKIVKWLKMKKIKSILINDVECKEKFLPNKLEKWDALENVIDPVSFELIMKFPHLNYKETKPTWLISQTKKNNDGNVENKHKITDADVINKYSMENINNSLSFLSNNPENNVDDGNDYNDDGDTDDDNFLNDRASQKNDVTNVNEENDDDLLADLSSEKMDIGILKKEILLVINQECIEINSDSEWSKELALSELLIRLEVTEREELSIGIVFVGLLHLANEYGLKLIQKYCPINDIIQTYVVQPINIKAKKNV